MRIYLPIKLITPSYGLRNSIKYLFCFQGYEELSEAYGFSSACLLKMDYCTFEAAAYMSLIIHNEAAYLQSINTDSLIQVSILNPLHGL